MNTSPSRANDLPLSMRRRRNLPVTAAFGWLGAGARDMMVQPHLSLFYGFALFLVSIGMVWGVFALNIDYILFPLIAGFMVVGPLAAIGLYQKSRNIDKGARSTLHGMLLVEAASGGQVLFTGVILCLLMLLWMRAAVIVYALFFGLTPFPGLDQIANMLFTTNTGWAMLAVGTAIGGLFAAFSFAISMFSIPMLLEERTDAFTAMGTSISLVWNNLSVMIMWGIIVLTLFLLSVATAFIGLIVIFPLLGHATWRAYKAIR